MPLACADYPDLWIADYSGADVLPADSGRLEEHSDRVDSRAQIVWF